MQTYSQYFGQSEQNIKVGTLAETEFIRLCHKEGYKVKLERNTLDWDCVVQGKKVDVKTLKNRFGIVEQFNVNVKAEQINPGVDVFAFYFFNIKDKSFTFAGALPKPEFLKKAKLVEAGSREKSGFVYHCDTYVVSVKELKSLEEALK